MRRQHRAFALACVAGAALVASSVTGSARQAPVTATPQQTPPTFRAGIDLVAVDVSVVDRNGRPVDDLKPADFTLKVDGRPREIVSAEFVSFRAADDGPATAGARFSTNIGRRPGRLIMIVVDESYIRKGSITKIVDAAAAFIDTLGQADRVALQIIPGTGPVVNFTSDHALVKRLLKTAVGTAVEAAKTDRVGVAEALEILERPSPAPGTPIQGALADLFERECPGDHDEVSLARCRRQLEGLARTVYANARAQAAATLVSLREIVERLAVTSDPKTVVLITEGVLVGRQFADVSWIAERTSAASVSFYALRVDNEQFDAAISRISPTRRADRELLVDGLNMVVGLARGTVFPLALNPRLTFARLNLELSGHYLLSFRPEPGDRDGKAHGIAIGVARRNVDLRARREFTVDPTTREKPVNARLVDALRSPLLLSDLDIRVTTLTYRDVDVAKLKVLIAAEIDRTNATGDLGLAYYVTDRNGNVVTTQVEPSLGPPPASSDRLPQSFTGAVLVEPGLYHLKLASVDQQGRSGSVEHAFEARLLEIGQLRVGDLMLAVPPRAGQSVRPSVDARITSETVVGYTELYSEAAPQLVQATVALEIAGSEDGPPMATTAMRVSAGHVAGKRTAEASLPLSLLEPGKYVARAVVSSNGRVVGRVTRAFVLERAAPEARFVVPAFDRAFVLTRPAVGFFLDRLSAPDLTPLPAALAPAVGLARTARFDLALGILEAAPSDHFAAPFVAGLAYFASGDLQHAVENFGASLHAAPTFFPAAFYLGACYAAAGRDRDALIAWRSVPMTEPAGSWVPTMMADSLLRLREPLQADDLPLLVRAMKVIYDERAAGRVIESADADRQRFIRYYTTYGRGPAAATIDMWRQLVDR